MEISDLKTLVAVVEHGSITRAAKELHRVPSGITTRILQLEESLGVQLFLREKKRLLVTPQGQELCDYAKKILDLLTEAERLVKGGEPGGRFRVGAMESTIAARLTAPLAKLHARYSDLQLELTAGTSCELFDMLMDNRLDTVFIADPPDDERVEYTLVYEEKLVFVGPEGRKPINKPGDIAKSTILAFNDGCSCRHRLLDWFREYGMEPERVADLTSYQAILGGAAAGMGIGIVPASVVDLFSQKEMLSVHPFDHPLATARTTMVWRKGMKTANITALLCYLGKSEPCRPDCERNPGA